ncbi:MAG: polysaccharide deacetylase family protein [Armatimonadetes bacterium]|nr:polysaccharide deacetylase family protein [Armatimonadota bacterium]
MGTLRSTELLAIVLGMSICCTGARAGSLVEQLGFSRNSIVLIINADDLGMCHAENAATFDALLNGVATSATVMMPCPWVPEVVEWKRQHPEADLGVHLTLTSEWTRYRWGPVLGRDIVRSLVDRQGYMWRSCEELWRHVKPEEAYRECRAQVEMAIRLGLDPTHLDNHMGSLQLNPQLSEIYTRLAKEFNLPVRMASEELYAAMGAAGQRKVYAENGILGPDELIYPDALPFPEPKSKEEAPAYYEKILRSLRPGRVYELYLHCAIDSPELQKITGYHWRRQADYEWLVSPKTRELIEELGIKLIGYRPLRDLQRRLRRG